MTRGLTRFEGFAVCVNVLMGVGFLSLPSAFVGCGLVLSLILLVFASVLLILTALWEAESILRATALKKLQLAASPSSGSLAMASFSEDPGMLMSVSASCSEDLAAVGAKCAALSTADEPATAHGAPARTVGAVNAKHTTASDADAASLGAPLLPSAEAGVAAAPLDCDEAGAALFGKLASLRTLEITEVCEVVVGPRAKLAYCICIGLYQFGTLWSYSSVFGEAIASIVPLPGVNGGASCDIYNEGGEAGCVALYRLWVGAFGAIGVPLALLGVKEQRCFQVVMMYLRMLVGLVMIATVAGAMLSGAERSKLFGEEADGRGDVPLFQPR